MEPLKFSFQFINAKTGQVASMFSKKGSVDDERLVLDKQSYTIDQIRFATRRTNRLILSVRVPAPSGVEDQVIVVQVGGGALRKVLPAINRRVSDRRADAHREQLTRAGRARDFREGMCPGCACTIDLTGHPPSPELYCQYCDTIWTEPADDPQRRKDETMFRCCDQCGLYSKPTTFTTFYFLFLVVVYTFSYKQKVMCNTCMRKEAWKMMGGNLLGLLGLPVAFVQLVRAYAGGSALNKTFAGLDKANALVKAGKTDAAAAVYDQITARLEHCCGVRYNYGLSLLQARRPEQAALRFAEALSDCGNYGAAAQALGSCYHQLGMTAELEALKREWADASAESAAVESAQA
jgi:hypothetical protein